MLIDKGFVSETKTKKMPRSIRTTADRRTALLVSWLILFSNGTLGGGLCPDGQDLGHWRAFPPIRLQNVFLCAASARPLPLVPIAAY